jgi:hypothetical protein
MDDAPMPETLDTIAAKLADLGKTMAEQFAKVDRRFLAVEKTMDERFTDVKAHLEIKIEALAGKVDLVYEAVIAQQKHTADNEKAHAKFTERLDDHDVRILALEPPQPFNR